MGQGFEGTGRARILQDPTRINPAVGPLTWRANYYGIGGVILHFVFFFGLGLMPTARRFVWRGAPSWTCPSTVSLCVSLSRPTSFPRFWSHQTSPVVFCHLMSTVVCFSDVSRTILSDSARLQRRSRSKPQELSESRSFKRPSSGLQPILLPKIGEEGLPGGTPRSPPGVISKRLSEPSSRGSPKHIRQARGGFPQLARACHFACVRDRKNKIYIKNKK